VSEAEAPTTERVVVNGFEIQVDVDRHLVDEVLVPTLATLIPGDVDGTRRFVFLAAPPGTGKSTLAAVVERRAAHLDLDTVGIDGFHHPQRHLDTHDLDGVPLASIKGAPETFDVARLRQFLERSATHATRWPVYDRGLHDVVPDARPVEAGLVLLEGNWLLLDEPGWRELSAHSVFNVFIDADPALLRERLIQRKVRGGLDLPAATRFYERSDRPNIDRVLAGTDRRKIDLLLRLHADGTIHREDT
jgi:hypothetical protein